MPHKKMTAFTAVTVVAADDIMVIDDTSANETKKVTMADALSVIDVLTAEATVDGAADYVALWDSSASAVRKVLPNNLPLPTGAVSADGTVALTANWDAGGYEIRAQTFESDVVTGTAPLVVASTTVVANLNADLLDGQEGAYYASAASVTAITSGYSRRQSVIARVDNTAAPPTEVSADRYLLDATGTSHAGWDGAAINQVVEFNGTTWDASAPSEGWIVYNDGTDTDWLYVDDGSPVWEERTAGGGVTDHGALSGLTDDDHTQYLLAAGTRAGSGIQELLGLNLTDSTELTIASGAITATQGYHTVDTESDAATDDLDTITVAGGEGDVLVIRPESSARTVVVKHGTGNVQCVGGDDITLDDDYDFALCVRKDASNWMAFSAGTTGGGSSSDCCLVTTAKTANYTAAAGDLVVCDTSAGAFSVTFPAAPSADDKIGIYIEHASFSLAVTVQATGGKTIGEWGSSMTLRCPGEYVQFQYDGVKWVLVPDASKIYSLDSIAGASIDETGDLFRVYDITAQQEYRATVYDAVTAALPFADTFDFAKSSGDSTKTLAWNLTNLKSGSQLVLRPEAPEADDTIIMTIRQHNSQTGAPGINDDEDNANSIGSLWYRSATAPAMYAARSVGNGAAAWDIIGVKKHIAATAAPGTGDDVGDGYVPGSVWVDTTNDQAYMCVDSTASAAVWKLLTTDTPALGLMDSLFTFPTDDYWYTAPATGAALTNQAISADTLYAVPFIVGDETTFDRIGVDIATTGTATLMRLGIYDSAAGMPNDLVVDGGEASANVSGNREVTISETLSPGLYFLAAVANGTVTFTALDSTAILWNYGHTAQGTLSTQHNVTGSHTYAAMPASFPSVTPVSGDVPRLMLRK